MEYGDDKTRTRSSSQMAKSSPKLKQEGKPSAFKKKLIHKKPTVKKEGNEDLKKPTICRDSPRKEGCSSPDKQNEIDRLMSLSCPSFLMEMLPSHISCGFWQGLPKKFCAKHLPKSNCTVTLGHESGKEHKVTYLAGKTALSGGWKAFSQYHSLEENDELFFELTKHCTFMVHILRELGSEGVVLNSDFQSEQPATVDAAKVIEEEEGNAEMQAPENTSDHSPNVSDKSSSEVSSRKFKDVKTLKDFKIIVNGLVIDSEVPEHIRAKYYQLCASQKGYLHSHLLSGINCKFASGAIIEVVNIADALKAVKFTTPLEEIRAWDKTLKICEDMGMEVGFLRSHIGKLIVLHSDEMHMIQTKMNERAKVEEDLKKYEARLLKVEVAMRCHDKQFSSLQVPKCRF